MGANDVNRRESQKPDRSPDRTMKDVREVGTDSNRGSERLGERDTEHWTYRPCATGSLG